MLRKGLCLAVRTLWLGGLFFLAFGLLAAILALIATDHLALLRPHAPWTLGAVLLLSMVYAGMKGFAEAKADCARLSVPPSRAGELSNRAEGPVLVDCPGCGQMLSMPRPIGRRIARCTRCAARFDVSCDRFGNLRIDAAGTKDEPLTVARALEVLGLEQGAQAADLRPAYKAQMAKYHPDKVAALGDELKAVAERKAKEINAAMRYLEENGYPG